MSGTEMQNIATTEAWKYIAMSANGCYRVLYLQKLNG